MFTKIRGQLANAIAGERPPIVVTGAEPVYKLECRLVDGHVTATIVASQVYRYREDGTPVAATIRLNIKPSPELEY